VRFITRVVRGMLDSYVDLLAPRLFTFWFFISVFVITSDLERSPIVVAVELLLVPGPLGFLLFWGPALALQHCLKR